jgi:hypothetical protein
MFYAKILLFIGLVVIIGYLALAAAAHAGQLPANLPKAECSTLNHLQGKEKWQHYLWHLCGEDKAKYVRISSVVFRESRWNPRSANPYSSARGLPQFLSSWYNGRWHFDPTSPILSLRVMVYVWNHPSLGGPSNWGM